MRWRIRFEGEPSDLESKELAKRQRDTHDQQREVVDALVESSTELAHESRFRLYANHFADSYRHAMKGE